MNLTVNGKPISKELVELEYQRLLKAFHGHLAPEELSRHSRSLQRQALDYAIGRLLLLGEARRQNIQVSPEEVDQAVDKLTRACGGTVGFQAHLKKLKLSPEALRRQVQEARQTEKLIEQITASCPKPTDDVVTAYLKDHAHEFLGKDTPPESQPPPAMIREHIRLALIIAEKNKLLSAFIARLRQAAVIQESETGS
ncbi:MAG: SurA N-terminal domain-containing protein [Verrucomicrobia bacterium]|nr:SurA N-terminal domain-containing protein [Verrucomicrobiota bacterium]